MTFPALGPLALTVAISGGAGASAWGALTFLTSGNLIASSNPTADLATIGAVITGIITLICVGMVRIAMARAQAFRIDEDARKGSLSEQLEDLKESLQKARESLDDQRDESNLKRLRTQEEIARLADELHSAHQELSRMRSDYHDMSTEHRRMSVLYTKLLANAKLTESRTRENAQRIATIEQSRDDIPTAPLPPQLNPPTQG